MDRILPFVLGRRRGALQEKRLVAAFQDRVDDVDLFELLPIGRDAQQRLLAMSLGQFGALDQVSVDGQRPERSVGKR
jgi:hypothetical protein